MTQAPERIWANVGGNSQTYLTRQNINHTEPYIRADLSLSPEAFQKMREALETIARGEVPPSKSFMQWHDQYQNMRAFARAALKAAEAEPYVPLAAIAAAYDVAAGKMLELYGRAEYVVAIKLLTPPDALAALERERRKAKNEALEAVIERLGDNWTWDDEDFLADLFKDIRAMKEQGE